MRVLVAAAMLTAGCATAPAADGGGGGKCDAAKAQKLLGRVKSAKVGNDALRLSGATALRWIAPGMMVTMDYREDRLNLHVGPDGKIARITCG
jgi:hypothetical protein